MYCFICGGSSLPEAVYTVIIAVFLYRIILLITEHLEKKGSENLIV